MRGAPHNGLALLMRRIRSRILDWSWAVPDDVIDSANRIGSPCDATRPRHRTVRSRGCLSNKTALAMIFKLAQAAEKSWHRLRGHKQLPKVILGVKFNDGIEVVRSQAQAAAA